MALSDSIHQDSASIERLPEENVSIVETLEGREERPETVRAIVNATARRKLYFNPSYFEPHLLLVRKFNEISFPKTNHIILQAPPPAAIEFLTKIREVIAIAKHKMATKRFTPSLMGIPEEDHIIEPTYDFSIGGGSRRSSMISLKRENSRRKTSCSGCPGCEPQDLKSLCGKLPEFPNMAACQSCTNQSVSESKQQSIRKWLEDVPILKAENEDDNSLKDVPIPEELRSPKRVRSPTRSTYSTKSSESKEKKSESINSDFLLKSPERCLSPVKSRKSKAPPPPKNAKIVSGIKKSEDNIKPTLSNQYDVIRNIQPTKKPLPPPDMINEAIEIDKIEEMPVVTKEMMAAVINEFEKQRGIDEKDTKKIDYEADSLERNTRNKNGYCTPPDYAEVSPSSSQPSPSLSTALPLDEELTMRNEIFNIKTGNKTISKISKPTEDDHDYELIVLNKKKEKFQLPELLQRQNGYSLVSEVYVNNGYNFGSAPSSRSGSNCSTLEKKKPKIRYDQPEEKPGHLTIEVEDCPSNYIRVEDSDSFEPDTLDRKPSRFKFSHLDDNTSNEYIDSLERPRKIMLKSTGSFKSGTINSLPPSNGFGNFNRTFGSLREIYEAKTKNFLRPSLENINFEDDNKNMSWQTKFSDSDKSDEGKLLTLEERQKRRQRRTPNDTIKTIPPDVIPPSIDGPIYEHPKPPRKVEEFKPPLPPKGKNGSPPENSSSPLSSMSLDLPSSGNSGNSSDFEFQKYEDTHESKNENILQEFIHTDDVIFKNGLNNQFILSATVQTNTPFKKSFIFSPKNTFKLSPNFKTEKTELKKTWKLDLTTNRYQHKPEDSGYLSTDSNDSRKKKEADKESETDESLGDGHSESGGESVETHSVFFDSYRKFSNVGSMDSGVCQLLEEVTSDQDTVSTRRSSKLKNKMH